MIKKLAIVVGALLVFAGAFVLKNSGDRTPGAGGADTDVAAGKPAAADVATADATTPGTKALAQTSHLPRLVDLGSDKCIPCKQMAPILEELRTEYQGSFVVEFIDVWKDPKAGEPYGIRVIPTQVFLDADGQERFRHEGFFAKEAILAKWAELGVALPEKAAPVES
ncbi:MAG: thioredoxin family protein [Candidatus Eisenbacteria bacterium]